MKNKLDINKLIEFKAFHCYDKSNPYPFDPDFLPENLPTGVFYSAYLQIKQANVEMLAGGQYKCDTCSIERREPIYHFYKESGQNLFDKCTEKTKEKLLFIKKIHNF